MNNENKEEIKIEKILKEVLKPADIENAFKAIRFTTKSYTVGELIAQSDEKCESLMLVIKGSVKGEMIDPSGKTIKIEDIARRRFSLIDKHK